MPQIDRLIPPSQKNVVVFRMTLISFILITYTERNITRKIWEHCYKKYRLHLCSGDIGITTSTTATLITIVQDFFRMSKKYI